MYKVFQNIVNAIESLKNPYEMWINLAGIIIPFIAVIISIIIAINSIRNNKKVLEETKAAYKINADMLALTQKDMLINSQAYYPIIKINSLDETNKEIILKNRVLTEKQSVSLSGSCELLYHFMFNLRSELKESTDCFQSFFFKITNISNAMIKSIQVINVSLPKPIKLNNNWLDYLGETFVFEENTLSYQHPILFKDDSIKLVFQMFLDDKKYVEYFANNNLTFSLRLKITTITGFILYQTIVYDGSYDEAKYLIGENKEDNLQTLKSGNIYIADNVCANEQCITSKKEWIR